MWQCGSRSPRGGAGLGALSLRVKKRTGGSATFLVAGWLWHLTLVAGWLWHLTLVAGWLWHLTLGGRAFSNWIGTWRFLVLAVSCPLPLCLAQRVQSGQEEYILILSDSWSILARYIEAAPTESPLLCIYVSSQL